MENPVTDILDDEDDELAGGGRIQYLPRERQFELARRWHEHGDRNALHELVMWHVPLAENTARKYAGYGLPVDDLTQEAMFGLIKAAERFDPKKDIRFGTYARWWVRASICEYVFRNWSIVTLPQTVRQAFFSLRRYKGRLTGDGDATLNNDERKFIAKQLRLSESDVTLMENRLAASDKSTNAPIGDEDGREYQDTLADNGPDPEQALVDDNLRKVRRRIIARCLRELTPRERRIVYYRHFKQPPLTLEELGERMGLSRERIRQIEKRGIERMRRYMAVNEINPRDLMD